MSDEIDSPLSERLHLDDSTTILYITRHVVTEFNKSGMVQGAKSNMKPSPEGMEQAVQLAAELQKYKIDVIYSSPLDRCRETIAPFIKNTNLPVHYVSELVERDYGIFDGKPQEAYDEWKEKNNIRNNFDYSPPEGESFRDVMKRVKREMDEIIGQNKGKGVLICGHNAVDVAICLGIFHQDPEINYDDYVFGNASLTIIRIRDGKPELMMKNNTEYLTVMG